MSRIKGKIDNIKLGVPTASYVPSMLSYYATNFMKLSSTSVAITSRNATRYINALAPVQGTSRVLRSKMKNADAVEPYRCFKEG
jgi:hypothetical protein